ncbi:S1 RNA-binding domain-containing protein [Streptomyces sp. NPDC001796]|uniref:S1 RNA-binding domain-containing protein n=1 Tax=Streptomyces sp. NPDC001796 TaxID=3364609 RepID=UPI0036B58B03
MANDPHLNYLSSALRDWLAQPLADETDPDVLVLAGMLCTPPIIPYRLLRRMRRSVLPRPGTLGIEGVLCSAWFVESLATDGFVFAPDFVYGLRTRLRAGLVGRDLGADREGLRRLIDEETAELSPLLRLEERLCWAYGTVADFSPTVDKIFTDVVCTIVQENRPQALIWAAGAFARLPREVIVGSGAWVLAHLCGVAGLPRPTVDWPEDGVDEGLLRMALPLLPDALLGLHRDGETLEIGTITRRRRTAIAVPAVSPKLLTVEPEGRDAQVVDLSTGPVRLEVGRSAVSIQDMRGRTYRLAAFTGAVPPEESVMDEALAELDRRWRERAEMEATVTRSTGTGSGLIVSFTDFPGCTGFLPASRADVTPFTHRRLEKLVGSTIRVRVINLDRSLQRVVVERVRMRWSTGNLAVGDEFEGPVVSKVNFGIFVSFSAAAGFADDFKLHGLVHRTELSWTQTYDNAATYPVEIGDMVRVRVIEIDADRERVILSIKQTQADPWTRASQLYRVGDQITARITKAVPFGWFLEMVKGFDALLHISEAPEGSTFDAGTQLTVWVINVDHEQHRMSLTLRRPPW